MSGFNVVMQTLLYVGKRESQLARKAAKHVLEIMHELQRSDQYIPNTLSYNLALRAVIVSARKEEGEFVDGEKALQFLSEMKASDVSKPDMYTYSLVIDALSKSVPSAHKAMALTTGEKCLSLLEEMKKNKDIEVDVVIYNSVLKTLSVVDDDRMTTKCFDILHEMEATNKTPSPDAQTYSAIMAHLAHRAACGDLTAIDRGSALLASMGEKANVFHCNIFLNALVKSPEDAKILTSGADRCMAFLGEMLLSETYQPDRITYNTAMNFLVKLVLAGDESAGEKCLVLLNEMKSSTTAPDNITFTTAMKAFATIAKTTPETAVKTNLDLLKEMEALELEPDLITYSILFQTMVNAVASGYTLAADISLDLLKEMKTHVSPNTIIYTKVLNAFVQRATQGGGGIEKCLLLLNEMKQNPKTSPDVVTYTSVLNALSKQIENTPTDGDWYPYIDICFGLLQDMNKHPKTAANKITCATIFQALSKKVEDGDVVAFDKLLELMSMCEMSMNRGDESPVLVPILELLKKIAANGEPSVIEKCTSVVSKCNELDLNLSERDVKRCGYSLYLIMKSSIKRNQFSFDLYTTNEQVSKSLALLHIMEESKHLRPGMQTYLSVMRGLNKRAREEQDPHLATEVLNIIERMTKKYASNPSTRNAPTAALVTAGIEAMTAIDHEPESTLDVITNCLTFLKQMRRGKLITMKYSPKSSLMPLITNTMDVVLLVHRLINLHVEVGVELESVVFEIMLNYCCNALIRGGSGCQEALNLHEALMKGAKECIGAVPFPPERITLRLLKPLAQIAENDNLNNHRECDHIVANAELHHKISSAHLRLVLRAKASTSFDVLHEYLQKDRSDFLELVDKEAIFTIFSSICFEKHRTDYEETLTRIQWATDIMRERVLPLTAKQEKFLREYNILEPVLQSMIRDANVEVES